jgi:hypothetical protein
MFPAWSFLLLSALSAFGGSAPDPWLIALPPRNGAITASTTRRELVKRYGAANVRDQDVGIGEGETEPGTALFPQDSQRLIEILWRDPATKLSPKFLTIRGKASRWKTAHEISLGTSLKQLEQINGRPFVLSGFGWDYSGTVESWSNGVLAKELEGNGRVLLRLDSDQPNVTKSELEHVEGDRSFPSSDPVMQKINPRVYEIVWAFP